MFVRSQEIVVCNLKCQVIVSSVNVIETVSRSLGKLIRSVKPFNHLLKWTIFFGNLIIVGKSNYLSDFEAEIITKLSEKLLRTQYIGVVTICDEKEVFLKLF